MEEIIKQLEEKKKGLEVLVDKLNTIIYDLKDYEDLIKDEEIAPINSKKGIEQRDQAREKLLKTEQKIKPIEIDLKPLTKKEIKLLKKFEKEKKVSTTKRKSRTKFPKEMEGFVKGNLDLKYEDLAEKVNEKFGLDMDSKKMSDYLRYRSIKKKVIYSDDPILKSKKSDEKPKAKQKKYPDEMADFVKEKMESNSSKQLCVLINEEYEVGINPAKLAAYMSYKKIKRERKANKYTNQVLEFLRENVNNFTNKEMCKELNMRFDIEVKVGNLQNFLSTRGIKRDPKPGIDQEIVDFVNKSKIKDAYAMRDKIIEKFEKNISMTEIREVMNQKKLSGESVQDEVKRIEWQREDTEHEDSIDDLDLDR